MTCSASACPSPSGEPRNSRPSGGTISLSHSVFGPSVLGMYNLAYNLADIPASQVGEQVADVLLPSFSHLKPEHRPGALVRAASLLALLMTPMAVGLGAVAPTLVHAFFSPAWQGIAPMLTILATLSIARPISWAVGTFLQASRRTGAAMTLEIMKLGGLLLVMSTLGRLSPLWMCGAAGVAFGLHTVGRCVGRASR